MKLIITLFTTVFILSKVLASTVYAQSHSPEDSVEEPPLTAEELANLVEPYPDLHLRSHVCRSHANTVTGPGHHSSTDKS